MSQPSGLCGLVRQDAGAYQSFSQEQTIAFGELLAEALKPNDVLVLTGDLGAGKTHLTKGIARGLGIDSAITSPTFTVMATYPQGRLPLYHLDIYRVEDADDLLDIDFVGVLEGDGVCVIEWGDRFPQELPDDYLSLTLSQLYDPQDSENDAAPATGAHVTEPPRLILLKPTGPRAHELAHEIDRLVSSRLAVLEASSCNQAM